MAATRWQTGHLWVTDWNNAPIELIGPYYDYGYRAVEVHLQDGGEVELSYIKKLKLEGFTVFGIIWVDQDTPTVYANRCKDECIRLGLNGIIVNAEDQIEALDQAQAGEWSKQFCRTYRTLMPGRSLALNTYSGCGGIHAQHWRTAMARLYVQTARGDQGFVESVEDGVAWAVRYGWKKSYVKPCLGVYKDGNGNRPDPGEMIASGLRAGTIGFSAYYADGTFDVPQYMARLGIGIGEGGIARL